MAKCDRRKLPKPKGKHSRQIADLCSMGFSNAVIADGLGISRQYVSEVVKRDGLQKNPARGELNVNLDRIVALVGQNKTQQEIADELGLKSSTIATYTSTLVSRGLLPRREPKGLDHLFASELVEMRRKGLTNQQIADHVGKPIGSLGVFFSRLIRAGLIERKQAGRRRARQ